MRRISPHFAEASYQHSQKKLWTFDNHIFFINDNLNGDSYLSVLKDNVDFIEEELALQQDSTIQHYFNLLSENTLITDLPICG